MPSNKDTRPLLYADYAITFQEVPDEITLVFNITGCTYQCDGCHSKYLWDYHGKPLLRNMEAIIQKYDGLITCVCFMGGDQNEYEFDTATKIAKSYGLKTCLYTGSNYAPLSSTKNRMEFIKLGPYIKDRGGLDSLTTNQAFYKFVGERDDGMAIYKEANDMFQKKRG